MKLSEQLKQDHECGDFGNALAGYSERAEGLERAAEIYAAERDHAKACYDRTVRLLTGIHALLYPPRFTDESLQAYMRKLVAGESQVIEPPVIPNQKPPARRKPRQPPRLMSSNAGSNGPSGVAAKVRVD